MRSLRLFTLAAGLALLAVNAAAQQPMPAQQLIDADKAFNDLAQREGVGKAFIAYSADDPALIRPGNMPILSKSELVDVFSKVTGSNLSWEPIRADIAGSQDLGYTFGRYALRESETVTSYGVYVTIWKKQPDGSWKFVLDGGGTTPRQVAAP